MSYNPDYHIWDTGQEYDPNEPETTEPEIIAVNCFLCGSQFETINDGDQDHCGCGVTDYEPEF